MIAEMVIEATVLVEMTEIEALETEMEAIEGTTETGNLELLLICSLLRRNINKYRITDDVTFFEIFLNL